MESDSSIVNGRFAFRNCRPIHELPVSTAVYSLLPAGSCTAYRFLPSNPVRVSPSSFFWTIMISDRAASLSTGVSCFVTTTMWVLTPILPRPSRGRFNRDGGYVSRGCAVAS